MFSTLRVAATVAFLAATLAIAGAASAKDDYPNKPINIVVTFAAGGNADIVARIEAQRLSAELGVPVNVINVPGGAHIPGVMNVLEKPADGYTLLRWSAPSMVTNPLIRKVPYDPLKDFRPLCAVVTASNALYVRADSPYKTFEEFVVAAKKKKLKIGVNNIGAPPHLSAVQLSKEFGLEFTTLTLKTVPATLTGIIGGHVDVGVGQLNGLQSVGDQVRPLIILDNQREAYFERDLPGVRTVGEAFPGKQAGTWIGSGLAIKAGTPDAIVERLMRATDAALNNKEFAAMVNKTVTYRWIGGAAAVSAKIKEGIDLYKPLLGGLGLLAK